LKKPCAATVIRPKKSMLALKRTCQEPTPS